MATPDPATIVGATPAFRLYHFAEVRAALALHGRDPDDDRYAGDPEEREPPPATEQGDRIASILARGEAGCWRRLAHPTLDAIEAVSALKTQAPHLAELLDLVLRHIGGQHVIGLPTKMPPILLVGPPGAGKSWACRRIAACLGVPFRSYAMNSATLSEGLTGNHGTWRNAGPGLVARTLLQEGVANPVFFIDELDKAERHGWNADPFRPFYSLLEPENARAFVDEYLGFAMDSSAASYLMTANSLDGLPAPLIDRLTVLPVPEMDDAQRRTVARAIFADLNQAMGGHFAHIEPGALDKLAECHPRRARAVLVDAMMRAGGDARRTVAADDLLIERPVPRRRIGF